MYNSVSENLIVSRDVIFVESEAWQWIENLNKEKKKIIDLALVVPSSHGLSSSSIPIAPPSPPSPSFSPPRKVKSLKEIYEGTTSLETIVNFSLLSHMNKLDQDDLRMQ